MSDLSPILVGQGWPKKNSDLDVVVRRDRRNGAEGAISQRYILIMQNLFVKARIIDATQGRVLFAIDNPDGTSLAYEIGYADACRFAGRLLNAADYHARRGHTLSMLATMDNQKATGCVGALINSGNLTIGQADRLL